MRLLKKNSQKLWYSLYNDNVPVYETDENGNIIYTKIDGKEVPVETGETVAGYSKPVIFYANISAGKGDAQDLVFGRNTEFTRTISSCDMELPIVETSLIWTHQPELDNDENPCRNDADYVVAAPVAKSINSILIAVKALAKG